MSEKVTDLIKKLLRLARDKSATPAEAAQALNRAMDLADKHAIDTAALDLDEISEKIVREDIEIGARLSFIKERTTGILQTYFKVKLCHCVEDFGYKRIVKLAVVGFQCDVTIAHYVFAFVERSASMALSNFSAIERKHRRKMNARKRKAFVHGWMVGLAQNLKRPGHESTLEGNDRALVLSRRDEQVRQFFRELFPETEKRKALKPAKHLGALSSGFTAGKDTTINTAISGHRPETLLLS